MHCTYVSLVRVTMGCRFSADVVNSEEKYLMQSRHAKKCRKAWAFLSSVLPPAELNFQSFRLSSNLFSWQIANDGPVALSEGQVIEATWKQLLMNRLTVFRSWFYCLQYLQQRTVTCLCPGKHRYVTFGY